MNDASFAAELQGVFLNEAQEMLEDTEAAFIKIEASPNDTKTIDKIFRLVHTIKGSAHVAGFTELGKFAHTFENLLGLIRDKKLTATAEVVDVLLAGNDSLRCFVEALKKDPNASVDCHQVSQRITDAIPPEFNTVSNKPTQKVESPTRNDTAVSYAESSIPVSVSTSKTDDNPLSENRTFLICDDEPDILELLKDILKSAGYKVIALDSARKALEVLQTQSVDAIMTDLKMPEMDGIEFVTAIRSTNRFIPIVFVSGHSSRDHFKTYLELGVDSFIDKPFGPEEILTVATRVIREKTLRDAVLSLSRLSFHAYVSVQKIRALNSAGSSTEQLKLEDKRLDNYMNDIRKATTALLDSERTLKK